MKTLKHMILYTLGRWNPKEETRAVREEIKQSTNKTNEKVKKVNKLLYNKDTSYFFAKSMGQKTIQ